MESDKRILLDQARASRARAETYRRLAQKISNRQSLAALEKCAAELEARAVRLERWVAGADQREQAESSEALAVAE